MSNRCSVCRSPDRLTVETAVRAGVSFLSLQKRFGLNREAIKAHMVHCVPAVMPHEPDTAPTSADSPSTGAVAQGIDALVTLLAQEVATSSGRARIDASREYRQALAEQAKSGGTRGPINLADIAEYATFRALLIRALAPYPEARLAVAEAIREGGF
jgi:hypothetical protein